METIILAYILLMHYVGDFILQSENMRKGKHNDIEELFSHIGVYSLVMGGASLALGIPMVWWAVNVFLHLIIDLFTSKMSHKLFSLKNNWWGMNVVGFDQLIHIFILISTYKQIV